MRDWILPLIISLSFPLIYISSYDRIMHKLEPEILKQAYDYCVEYKNINDCKKWANDKVNPPIVNMANFKVNWADKVESTKI